MLGWTLCCDRLDGKSRIVRISWALLEKGLHRNGSSCARSLQSGFYEAQNLLQGRFKYESGSAKVADCSLVGPRRFSEGVAQAMENGMFWICLGARDRFMFDHTY